MTIEVSKLCALLENFAFAIKSGVNQSPTKAQIKREEQAIQKIFRAVNGHFASAKEIERCLPW